MISSDKTGVQLFVQRCVNNGMKSVVCSPGSRNAPLVIAFDEHPDIETFVIHDERSAAFYGLGMALEENLPVGLVCTSGSAMLNYYPAVAEAYYQCVPLIVMSADRPKEWINHGDGQTIVQEGVYDNHILGNYTVPEFILPGDEDRVKSCVDQVFRSALTGWIGPVHFNFPLSEPLYNSVEIPYPSREVNEWTTESQVENIDHFVEAWNRADKKMIICGQMQTNPTFGKLLNDLSEDCSVAILVENTSNIHGKRFVHCIDRTLNLIAEDEIQHFAPDLLITFGGAIVSKRIKSFLRNTNIREHWKVGFDFPEMDTFRALTKSILAHPEDFTKLLLQNDFVKNRSNFGSQWKQLDYLVKDHLYPYLETVPFSDLATFNLVLDYLPENMNLHMANSSVVRYCQLFDPVDSVKYYCNRGTSGIDGSTSTACGVSIKSTERLNVLITGDVSFFYDSNALWNKYIDGNLRIILINNGGGGIFRYIQGPSGTKQLETYFEARHRTSAKHICKAFDIAYQKANDLYELERLLPGFYNSDGKRPVVIEVFTPSEVNDVILREFFKVSSNWR